MEKTTIKISKVFKGASYTLKKLKLLQLHPLSDTKHHWRNHL